MRSLIYTIISIFGRKKVPVPYRVCRNATGELGAYCVNELHISKDR